MAFLNCEVLRIFTVIQSAFFPAFQWCLLRSNYSEAMFTVYVYYVLLRSKVKVISIRWLPIILKSLECEFVASIVAGAS